MEIIIREANIADAVNIARVHTESQLVTHKDILPEKYKEFLINETKKQEEMWIDNLQDPGIGKNMFMYVAENSEKIIGFVIGGEVRSHRKSSPEYTSELASIYILSSYQNQGIGKKLTKRLVEKLINTNHKAMLLWVLEENPSRPFYEAICGEILEIKETSLAGKISNNVCYGWNNLDNLLNTLNNKTKS